MASQTWLADRPSGAIGHQICETVMSVIALPTGFVPGDAEPVQKVIDLLEEALERARSGKLDGVAIVMVERNPHAFEVTYTCEHSRHTLAAGVLCLVHRVGRRLNDGDDG